MATGRTRTARRTRVLAGWSMQDGRPGRRRRLHVAQLRPVGVGLGNRPVEAQRTRRSQNQFPDAGPTSAFFFHQTLFPPAQGKARVSRSRQGVPTEIRTLGHRTGSSHKNYISRTNCPEKRYVKHTIVPTAERGGIVPSLILPSTRPATPSPSPAITAMATIGRDQTCRAILHVPIRKVEDHDDLSNDADRSGDCSQRGGVERFSKLDPLFLGWLARLSQLEEKLTIILVHVHGVTWLKSVLKVAVPSPRLRNTRPRSTKRLTGRSHQRHHPLGTKPTQVPLRKSGPSARPPECAFRCDLQLTRIDSLYRPTAKAGCGGSGFRGHLASCTYHRSILALPAQHFTTPPDVHRLSFVRLKPVQQRSAQPPA